ncbi:tyrosine-type recombinase/integrase [Micromonospora sp. DT233]|uniref:tyrosine-type recombinase/integrase n=1 Tax=Micromonospora sp. DT233 TaxID=3393432 RepID=UPI003CF846C3
MNGRDAGADLGRHRPRRQKVDHRPAATTHPGEAAPPRHQDPGIRRPRFPTSGDRTQTAKRTTRRGTTGRRNSWQESDLVFTTRYGIPIEPRNLQRSWQTRCDRAGVKSITVYDARRTGETLLADLDVYPRVAMQILRHARFSVTLEIYTHASSKAI